MKLSKSQIIFSLALLLAVIFKLPWLSLLLGTFIGLTGFNFLGATSHKYARFFLTCSVVLLGFCIPIQATLAAGVDGLFSTTVSVFLTIGVGLYLGKLCRMTPSLSLLISAGSAICGASAIVALSKVIKASDEEIALSLATIFSLNALALLTFPILGSWLDLSQQDFGIWTGIAIHDTSSVAGAAAFYGEKALTIAVPVKLARAIWIVPLCILAGLFWNSRSEQGRIRDWIPPFLYLFFLASALSSVIPWFNTHQNITDFIVKTFLAVTLFLIGTGITLQALRKVGLKPLMLGSLLWVLISLGVLAALGNK
jgi:uncharacterized integral membrane protein (TIGR00698 family)